MRLRLRERWLETKREPESPHPVRPKSYASFTGDFPMCGGGNEGFAGTMSEHLHPLGDLRLVRFLLSVPAIPWCRDKYLIRTALKGILPEEVRLRPKAPLAGFPYLERARRSQRPELPAVPALERYVDLSRLPKWPVKNREELDYALRVLSISIGYLGYNPLPNFASQRIENEPISNSSPLMRYSLRCRQTLSQTRRQVYGTLSQISNIEQPRLYHWNRCDPDLACGLKQANRT